MPARFALAIDLGGTKVESALVDASGRVLDGSRSYRPTGASSTSNQLAAHVREVITDTMTRLPQRASLLGVGIGSAGPIAQDQGLVSPLNLPAWRSFPLVALVSKSVPGLPVTMRMDGLCITLAEYWVGAAQGQRNVMGMVVSTGIGGGLILSGRTFQGSTGNAGHIGHIEVAGFEDACTCGGTGCVEAVASGPRSVAWARRHGWAGSTGEELAESYAAGNSIARMAVERAGTAIGRAIGSAASLIDLSLVVIGGGFSTVTPDLFDYIRTGIKMHSSFEFACAVQVVPSALSNQGPLIGAAALVHRADMLR